jgi:hypothetical protein
MLAWMAFRGRFQALPLLKLDMSFPLQDGFRVVAVVVGQARSLALM